MAQRQESKRTGVWRTILVRTNPAEEMCAAEWVGVEVDVPEEGRKQGEGKGKRGKRRKRRKRRKGRMFKEGEDEQKTWFAGVMVFWRSTKKKRSVICAE